MNRTRNKSHQPTGTRNLYDKLSNPVTLRARPRVHRSQEPRNTFQFLEPRTLRARPRVYRFQEPRNTFQFLEPKNADKSHPGIYLDFACTAVIEIANDADKCFDYDRASKQAFC